jgi:hypothetical protein
MINLKHNSFLCIYLNSPHVSSNLVLIIRRINCISTTSGICHSMSVQVQFGKELSDPHTKRSPTQSDIYQMLYWYNWFSWWWARGCSKHVGNLNKYIKNNCASTWSFTKDLYVLGVDEMVILKLMLKKYGIGISTLCNWFSTVINTGWTRQKKLRLILSKRRKNFYFYERLSTSDSKLRVM